MVCAKETCGVATTAKRSMDNNFFMRLSKI
jgi:hypothetical protein